MELNDDDDRIVQNFLLQIKLNELEAHLQYRKYRSSWWGNFQRDQLFSEVCIMCIFFGHNLYDNRFLSWMTIQKCITTILMLA
jgi:hypothetical protein